MKKKRCSNRDSLESLTIIQYIFIKMKNKDVALSLHSISTKVYKFRSTSGPIWSEMLMLVLKWMIQIDYQTGKE